MDIPVLMNNAFDKFKQFVGHYRFMKDLGSRKRGAVELQDANEPAEAVLPAQAETEEARPREHSLDGNAVLERVGGDRELLQEVVALFQADSPHLLGEIRAAFLHHDLSDLGRAAHKLKGAAGNFSAKPVVDAALHLETLVCQGDWANAGLAILTLEEELGRLRSALDQLVQENRL